VDGWAARARIELARSLRKTAQFIAFVAVYVATTSSSPRWFGVATVGADDLYSGFFSS
jgi:hypothetical protein